MSYGVDKTRRGFGDMLESADRLSRDSEGGNLSLDKLSESEIIRDSRVP